MTRVNECTGVCCRRFFLPHDKRSLPDGLGAARLRSQGFRLGLNTVWFPDDIVAWGNLLEFIEPYETADGRPGGFWRCRAWDEATGLCRIYEHRPKACADYPYGGACEHCGGTGVDAC